MVKKPKAGGVLYVLPTIKDEMPDELKDALALRRQSTVRGHCDCGAIIRVTGPGTATMEHKPLCPVGDEAIAEIKARTGWSPDD